MNINPPIAVTALIAATLGGLALHRGTEPERASDDRCAVVIAFLKSTLDDEYVAADGRKLFLTIERARFALPLDDSAPTELREEVRRDPLYPLYLELADLDGVDPRTRCRSLNAFLKSDGVRQRFTTLQPKRTSKDEWDAIYLSVSMPAVSEDGQEAIMLSGMTFAPLAGGGSEIYLRKDKRGEWRIKYERSTWIS